MICKICDREFQYKGFARHLKVKHNMSTKDYYDKFIGSNEEELCPVCGKFITTIDVQ